MVIRKVMLIGLLLLTGLGALNVQADEVDQQIIDRYDFSQEQARTLRADLDNYVNFTDEERDIVAKDFANRLEIAVADVGRVEQRGFEAYLGSSDYLLYDTRGISGFEKDFVQTAPFLINAKKHKAAVAFGKDSRAYEASYDAGRALLLIANNHEWADGWRNVTGHETGFYGTVARAGRLQRGLDISRRNVQRDFFQVHAR